VKWRGIKVNVRFSLINSLRYLTFSSARAVFGRPLPGFRSVADPRSSTRLGLQIAFTEQSFQPFSGNFATIFRYPKPSFRNVSIRALSSYDILPITKVIGLTAIMTWNEQYDNLHFPVTYSVSPPLCIALQRTFVSTYKLYSHKSAAIVNILPT